MMNRRNVLIGLGGIVAGGGALLSSGAFSQVEASRTVSITTAGDAAAFLQLEPGPNGGEYVDTDTDGVVSINIDALSTTDGGDGLNREAVTAFDGVLTITNAGTDEVDLDLTLPTDPGVTLYDSYTDKDTITTLGTVTLAVGASVDVGLAVDTGHPDGSAIQGTAADGDSIDVTIVAETTTP